MSWWLCSVDMSSLFDSIMPECGGKEFHSVIYLAHLRRAEKLAILYNVTALKQTLKKLLWCFDWIITRCESNTTWRLHLQATSWGFVEWIFQQWQRFQSYRIAMLWQSSLTHFPIQQVHENFEIESLSINSLKEAGSVQHSSFFPQITEGILNSKLGSFCSTTSCASLDEDNL